MNKLKKSLFDWAVLFAAFSFLIISCGKEEGDEAKPNPVVSALNPSSGYVGDAVTITGKNFGTDKAKVTVLFGGNATAELTSVTDTEIKITVPTGATTGKITVKVEGRAGISSADFVVLQAPEVTALPAEAFTEKEMTITGKNFGTDKSKVSVLFKENVAGEVTAVTDTEIKVLVPATAVSGPLTLKVGAKEVTTTELLAVKQEVMPMQDFINTHRENSDYVIEENSVGAGNFGYAFVPKQSGLITHFGLRQVISETYTVVLWDAETKKEIHRMDVTVNNKDQFFYQKLEKPIQLTAGKEYRYTALFSTESSTSKTSIEWLKFPLLVKDLITIKGQVFTPTTTVAYPDRAFFETGTRISGLVDFKFHLIK